MSFEVKVTVKLNHDALKKDLEGADLKTLRESGALVSGQMKYLCAVDQGGLRDSIDYEVIAHACYVGTESQYGPWVEHGTGPHMPPIEPLQAWAQRVLGDPELAWPIALKIRKYGTKAQPFAEPAIILSKKAVFEIAKRNFSEVGK